ncbi:hypothetical protein BH11PSE8_BH11PSE8_10260 [soil metagenome]
MSASNHPYPELDEHDPSAQGPGDDTTLRRARHWRSVRRLTGVLMLIWFTVTFVVAFYARELSARFAGWPFSFWMAAQGAPIVYVLLVGWYARRMNRIDLANGLTEGDSPATTGSVRS